MSGAPVIERLSAQGEGDYAAFVAAQGASSTYHSLDWRDLLCAVYGYEPCYLLAREHGIVTGVLPLVSVAIPLRGRHLSGLPFSHRVPLLATRASREALLASARDLATQLRVNYLELREDPALLGDGDFAPATGYWQSVLDLQPALEALWRQVRSSTRRNVARAERAGVSARRAAGAEDYRRFYCLMLETRRQQGAPPYPREHFERLARLNWARLYVADDAHGVALAGLCIFMHGGQALYAYGASSKRPEHLEQRPNDLLFWHVIAALRAEGMTALDFGVSPEHLSDLRRYKENWGAVSARLHHARWSPSGTPARGVARNGALAVCATRVIRHTPMSVLAWLGNRFFKYFG